MCGFSVEKRGTIEGNECNYPFIYYPIYLWLSRERFHFQALIFLKERQDSVYY